MQDQAVARVPGTAAPFPAPAVGWYATIVLAFLYWLSILDRFIISLMVDPIKRDMGITDLQFGYLHGIAFAITFSLFGLVAGALADRFSRRWIIFASVSVWSMATAACGMAVHYWQLLLARVGVGMGEAGLNPSATSILTDLFPREKLTTAIAVYALGATIGSGTAFLMGGIIVDLASQSNSYILPLVGEVRSWQVVFFVIGIPGVLLSLVVFTFPEPVRRDRSNLEQHGSFWNGILEAYINLLKFMRTQWRFFAHHYSSLALASTVMSGCGVWYPAHMSRNFDWSATQIGLYLGPTMIVASIVGKLAFGRLADHLYVRGYRDAQYRIYAVCLALATPIGVAAMMTDNPWFFLSGLAGFLTLISPFAACNITALNLSTPNELRGTGIAFFSGTAGLIALATGPVIIAWFSDQVFGGNAIGLAMAATIAICCPIGAIILSRGCRAMRTAVTNIENLSDSATA